MRAALLREFDQSLTVDTVDIDSPRPDEVLIRVHATGICHSDRFAQTGGNPAFTTPMVLGHESAGVVVEAGSGVSSVQPGDHVVVGPAGSCGTCVWCSRGEPQHCVDLGRTRTDGSTRLTHAGEPVSQFVGVGGFAEFILVREAIVAKVSRDLPLEIAALLGCAVITGLGAVRHSAQVRFGDTVAVIGCGGVGLSAIQGAALSGAARIIAVDRVPEKLELARGFGATDTVDASNGTAVDAVRELTDGGVDHVIEAVGLPATIQDAYAMLGIRGTATVIGLARAGDRIDLPATDLLAEKRLQGSRLGGTRLRDDIPLYARMHLAGRLNLEPLLGAVIDLADLPAALDGIDASLAARTVVRM